MSTSTGQTEDGPVRRPDEAEPHRSGASGERSGRVASPSRRSSRVRGVAHRRHGLRRPEQSLASSRFTGGRAHFVVPAGDMPGSHRGGRGLGWPPGSRRHPGPRRTGGGDASRSVPAETLLVHVGGQGGTAVGATPGRGGWNGGGDGGAAVDRADGRPGQRGLRRRRGDRRPARRREARGPHPGRRWRRRGRRRRDRRPATASSGGEGGSPQRKRRIRAARIRQSRDRRTRRHADASAVLPAQTHQTVRSRRPAGRWESGASARAAA